MNRKELERLLDEADDLFNKGEWKGARKVLQRAIEGAPDDLALRPTLAKAHLLFAEVLLHLTDFQRAIDEARKALDISNAVKDRGAEGEACRLLGHIMWKKGDYKSGLEVLKRGLERAREAKDLRLEGIIHIERAMIHATTGDLAKAERDYRESILALERTGDRYQLARAYNNLGDNFMCKGEFGKAADFFTKSMRMAERANNAQMVAFAAFNRAECHFELGRYDEALTDLDMSLPVLEKAGDTYGQAGANQILGLVHAKKGDWHKAEEHLIKARRLAQKNAMPVSEAKIIRDIGRMYKWRGDKDKALLYLTEAKEIFERHGADGEIHKMKDDMDGLA